MTCSEYKISLKLNRFEADGGYAENTLKIGEFTWKAVCRKNQAGQHYEVSLEVEAPPLALWSIELALKTVVLASNALPGTRNKYYTYQANMHRRSTAIHFPISALLEVFPDQMDTESATPHLEVELHLSLGRTWFENLAVGSDISDTQLEVDGTLLHVSKTVLAMHCSYFLEQFNVSQDVYRVDSVELDDFITFLSIIYPTALPVDHDNYERMLKLAQRFDCNAVFNAFSKYLSRENRVDPEALVIADQYNLIQDVDRILAYLPASTIRILTVRGPLSLRVSDRLKVMMLERLARVDDQVRIDVNAIPPQSNVSLGGPKRGRKRGQT